MSCVLTHAREAKCWISQKIYPINNLKIDLIWEVREFYKRLHR